MRNSPTNLSPYVLIVTLLLVAIPAMAIERHDVEPLPDDGFGSTARRLDPGSAATVGEVVGEIFQPDGSRAGTIWTWGGDTGWTATKLPTPAGFESVANAIAFAPLRPAELVVGTIIGSERELAVLWANDGTGWTVTQLPTPDGFGSRALGLDPGSVATVGEVVGGDLPAWWLERGSAVDMERKCRLDGDPVARPWGP